MADKEDLTSTVSQLVKDCKGYREQLAAHREKAMRYFDGKIDDIPVQVGRSSVVSRDVRANIKKVLPSLIRIILGNDKVVEYEPVGPGDEQSAEQATDYINYFVFPESNGFEAVQNAIHDALTLRNGIIRWWYDSKITVTVSEHTGLDEQQLVQLVQDDEITVLAKEQTEMQVDGPQGPVTMPSYSVKIRRRNARGRTRLAAVPPEQFLIHPDALDIEESPLTGLNMRLRRSELVAMGYDRDQIDQIPSAGTGVDHKENEENDRRTDIVGEQETAAKAMQEIEYYELYARVDADDDGIAELRRIVYAGAIKEEYKLSDEEWDEVPFADITVERRPHQREGNSVADDTMDIQRVKTVLLRETLDNLYWQNKPQPIVQEGSIANPDAVLNPTFGKPIRVNEGMDVRSALGFTQVPFVAASSFQMLDYFDREATDRTGISDASSGLAPDALQNVTATATALIEQGGIGQTQLMVWTVARGGLKRVFRGLLKLIIKHQDQSTTRRLRGQWIAYDPRQWNAEMDCTVNTGLGAGTRERDMAMMQVVGAQQEKLLAAYGPTNNPFVSIDNIWNSVSRGVEAAGLRSPDMYFTKPTPEQIQQMQQADANKQDPEMQKIQMQMQADQQKAQADFQLKQQEAQFEQQFRVQQLNAEMELKRYQIDKELELKRQQNVAQIFTQDQMSNVHLGGQPG